jgi:hypothetical protein|tara:strand:- start:5978 stop:6619 length:642 start_codon:yes stop_codon:yes gene_type:complete
MKVKIKKEGKTKEFKLINSWNDVTLESWAKLIDFENGSKSNEAIETIKALSDIPEKLIKQLSLNDVATIMSKVGELQQNANYSLKRIIKVGDKEYGYHPDLNSISLGEWADLETFIKAGLDKNLPEVCAVLYRPIVEKKNKKYTIEAYDGEISIRAEEFKKMSAEQVQGALVFFWTFVKELLKIMPLYLMERTQEIKKIMEEKILPTNGVISE